VRRLAARRSGGPEDRDSVLPPAAHYSGSRADFRFDVHSMLIFLLQSRFPHAYPWPPAQSPGDSESTGHYRGHGGVAFDRSRLHDDGKCRDNTLAPAQVAALLSGEIDLALLRPPVERSDLLVQTVRRDRLLVALPQGHALTFRSELRITDLRDEEFVAHAGHGRSVMNSVLTGLCAEAGLVPRVRHEVEETSTLVTLVAAGLGVAVVPDPTASLDIAGVCYRRWYLTDSESIW
jgi:hypothetical protein